jgi:hypothetical protein
VFEGGKCFQYPSLSLNVGMFESALIPALVKNSMRFEFFMNSADL